MPKDAWTTVRTLSLSKDTVKKKKLLIFLSDYTLPHAPDPSMPKYRPILVNG